MGFYKAAPGGLVLGRNILNTVEALTLYKDAGYRFLAEVGIPEITEEEWYDQQKYTDFLELLKTRAGATTIFVAGRNIGLNAPLPPQLNTPAKVLSSFNEVYKMNHKNVPPTQGWTYTPTGDCSATMVCTSPYPDDFARGVCDGFIRRFKTGALYVNIDESKPRVDKGGKSVTYLVRWG